MTITLQAVNELIDSLESAGELSIKERKYLELAKEFRICSTSLDAVIRTGNALADQNAQLAAENAALKSKGKELLGEACAVYSRLNKLIDPSIGDFVDGQTLHEFQFVLDVETPATDAFLAGIKADGVALVKSAFEMHIQSASCYQDEIVGMESAMSIACQVESQLREGADK
ncbi:Ead/Ea22-like family protein [Klebsiella quasipneumoniae subsp. similipneumoniae]